MKVIAYFVTFLILLSSGVQAEVLTLEQALTRAMSHDPRINEKKQYVSAARALLQEVHGSDDLQFDLTTFLGSSTALKGGLFTEDSCSSGNFTCSVRDDRYDLGQGLTVWTYLDMKIAKPIATFGKFENFEKAARENIKIKSQDVRLQRGSSALDVKRAWYGYLAARDSEAFLLDIAQRIASARDQVADWLKQGKGDVSNADEYALKSAEGLIKSYSLQAQSLKKIAMQGLRMLTAWEQQADPELDARRLVPLAVTTRTLEELQSEALVQRPEMEQVRRGMKAMRHFVEGQRAMNRPNLFVGGIVFVSYSPGRERLDNPFIYDPFNDYGATPVMGVQWKWEKGVNDARTEKARAELGVLVEKAALARDGIPFQVLEAYTHVVNGAQAVKHLAGSAKNARRWMISRIADFDAGLVNVDKVVPAFQAYVLAYTDYLKLVYSYNLQVAQLENVIGDYQ